MSYEPFDFTEEESNEFSMLTQSMWNAKEGSEKDAAIQALDRFTIKVRIAHGRAPY